MICPIKGGYGKSISARAESVKGTLVLAPCIVIDGAMSLEERVVFSL
jgi:hypothetical protein